MEKRRCRRAEIESRHQNLKFKTGETSNLGKETAGPLCRELASAIEKGPGGKKSRFFEYHYGTKREGEDPIEEDGFE